MRWQYRSKDPSAKALLSSTREQGAHQAVCVRGSCLLVCVCPQEKLGPQCMRWLEDQVASIREAATKTLQKIAQVCGVAAGRAAPGVQPSGPARMLGGTGFHGLLHHAPLQPHVCSRVLSVPRC